MNTQFGDIPILYTTRSPHIAFPFCPIQYSWETLTNNETTQFDVEAPSLLPHTHESVAPAAASLPFSGFSHR